MSSYTCLLGSAQRFTYHLAWACAGWAVYGTNAEDKSTRIAGNMCGVAAGISMVAFGALSAFGSFGTDKFVFTKLQVIGLAIPTVAMAVFLGAIVMKKYGYMTPKTATSVKFYACLAFANYHTWRSLGEISPLLLRHLVGTVFQGAGFVKSAVFG